MIQLILTALMKLNYIHQYDGEYVKIEKADLIIFRSTLHE